MYKHNFAEEIISGIPSIHLINKNKSLYRELFPKKNNKNQYYINTEANYKKIPNVKKPKKYRMMVTRIIKTKIKI